MSADSLVRISLYRDAGSLQWGFRLHGGVDIGAPLSIQRVFLGTPSEGELHRGDVIVRIGDRDATRFTHQEAQLAIKNAGNNLNLAVLRSDPKRFIPPPPQNNPSALNSDIDVQKQRERAMISNQPHRTFPLHTPGIKVKHDVPTGSYLRHVHNDPFGHNPRQLELSMKTKVQESVLNAGAGFSAGSSPARSLTPEVFGHVGHNSNLVHRQYNSPINLYSAQNVADTIAGQTGVTPTLTEFLKEIIMEFAADAEAQKQKSALKNLPKSFDITKSPTYQHLYEQEWKDLRTSELREHKPVQNKVKIVPPSQDLYYTNSFGAPKDKIYQSHSFNMIRDILVGETDF